MVKQIVYIFLIVLFLSKPILAATYYIDFVGGNDSDNGSISDPWKHCPGDSNATGNPSSISLVAGDTIIFKGGVQYDGMITLYWSGSSDSERITYDGNSAGTFGSGRGIIDGGDTRQYGFISTSARSYLTIQNLEIRNIPYTTVGTTNPDGGIVIGDISTNCVGIKVLNCYIWDIAYWEPDGTNLQYGACVAINRMDNCLIDGNEFYKGSRWAVRMYGAKNTTVSNNNIHDYFQWAIDVSSAGWQQNTDNIIRDNTIHDIYQYDCKTTTLGAVDEGYWEGPSCTSPDNPHTDFIFLRDAGSELPPLRTIVERNLFYNDRDFESHYDGTAMIYNSDTQDTVIRNNIFINPHSARVIHDQDDSDGTKIYNNTFYGRTVSPGTVLYLEGTNVTLKNNIIVSSNYNLQFANTAIIDACENNLFVPVTRVAYYNSSAYTTLSSWQSIGFDLLGDSVASPSDVKFVSISGFGANSSSMDLSLQSDSPAIGLGANLSATFTDDYSGNTRSNWDAGAYEYQSGEQGHHGRSTGGSAGGMQ